MTKSLREEIEQVISNQEERGAWDAYRISGYRDGALEFAIRALEMAAETARPYGRGAMYAILKLADGLRGSK